MVMICCAGFEIAVMTQIMDMGDTSVVSETHLCLVDSTLVRNYLPQEQRSRVSCNVTATEVQENRLRTADDRAHL